MEKIGLLTYHHIPNNGAALFAYSMQQALRSTLPEFSVEILDHREARMQNYERMKILKPYLGAPGFNFQRQKVFAQFHRSEFDYDNTFDGSGNPRKLGEHLQAGDFAAWVTGMDVWNIGATRWLPDFPNAYWLPWQSHVKKIAYAVSGYRSDNRAVELEKDQIGRLLEGFELIGVRDGYTGTMVQQALGGAAEIVVRVPDPTFLYEVRSSGVEDELTRRGIDPNRPLLGVLVHGKGALMRPIREHYHKQGYQLAALSMYNPHADVNLGHRLDPHAWADCFRNFSFCLSDRFHGAIFCLKSGIPFIAIEPDRLPSMRQSKLHDLLAEFDLLECYIDPHREDFHVEELLERAGELEREWHADYRPAVEKRLTEMETRSLDFLARVRKVVSD